MEDLYYRSTHNDFLRHSWSFYVVISVSCTVLSFYIDLYSPSRQHKDRTGQDGHYTTQYNTVDKIVLYLLTLELFSVLVYGSMQHTFL